MSFALMKGRNVYDQANYPGDSCEHSTGKIWRKSVRNYDAPVTASQAEAHYTDERLQAWVAKIHHGDGFIVVTPEYNHGYPAVLKSALDAAYQGWNNKPIAFVSYGGNGAGTRAVEQLRLVSIDLQMVPIRNAVTFQFVSRMFDELGKVASPVPAKQADPLLNQLVWWAGVLQHARKNPPQTPA